MSLGEPHVMRSIVPSWSRVEQMGTHPDSILETPVRVCFVCPTGPGLWVDTTLEDATVLVTKLAGDITRIKEKLDRG